MLSLAAAHLSYLLPLDPRYHRAKHCLLGRALHDYRNALSAPITPSNCDSLLGGAILVHYLLWCDLSFMDGQDPSRAPLDLSSDRLYWLSTGQRQIFFMAWPLFQREESIFTKVGILQPCMAMSDEVEARGLNWRRIFREFDDIYDNPRYKGGRKDGSTSLEETGPLLSEMAGPSPSGSDMFSESSGGCPLAAVFDDQGDVGFGFELSASNRYPPLRVSTLFDSYREGEAFVRGGGVANETLTRASYKRLAERVAIAMVFTEDARKNGSCPVSFSQEDTVRYVLTFPMLCFGPLLPLISSGDSRVLLLLLHSYQAVEELLPSDKYWWCRKRVVMMRKSIMEELRARGLEVCRRSNRDALW
ncbi:hypothetical protein B0T16DRAFT_413543 [Cercophora newfieldiana]|uniref:Uncharacterized protein n=1 Tax=Cercophora newfieldiana TaxID=92897 RepID=A0AA39Y685_9PEZI|nr:hypothetical protein B0T16DRAFT_413543 [Cercophora newfieldiana]